MAFQGKITNAGRAFEAQLKAQGKPLIFCRAAGGTGLITDLVSATDLADARCAFHLKYTEPIDGTIELYSTLSIDSVAERFLWQQWGLWASDGEGTEVLYLLSQDETGQMIDPGQDIVDYRHTIILSGELEVTVTVNPLGPVTQADIGRAFGVAPLDGEQKVPMDNLPELPRSGVLTIPVTDWQAVMPGNQEAEDGATVYIDMPLSGALSTDKVHGELVPETREIARDAGMLDYTRVINAGAVRVYAESVPTGAISLQYTVMPANAGEKPVGYIAGLESGGHFLTYTAEQVGGTSGTVDSTGIVITFSKAVKGLTADDITLTNGTGTVVKGSLSGDGTTWTIGISTTMQGTVSIFVRSFGDYYVTTEFQTVTVYAKTRVTFTATQIGGSASANTTAIQITFSSAVTGLQASHITLTNGTGSATKGTLSGSGTTWTLTITPTMTVASGTITVAIANFGNFIITTASRSVTIYDPHLVLYEMGDEKKSITGGFTWSASSFSDSHNGGLIKNSTNMQFWGNATSNNDSAFVYSQNAINATGYTKLCASVRATFVASGDMIMRFYGSKALNVATITTPRTVVNSNIATTTVITFDISSMSSGYVQFYSWLSSGTGRADLYIEKIWLE